MGLPARRPGPHAPRTAPQARLLAGGAALKLLGLVGWSGSGKTTLLVAVLPLLRAAGLRVSTIKHAHHGLELDKPGKDSFRHREAGAEEVLVVGGQRWALLRELPSGKAGEAPDLAVLAGRLAPVDLVLVEGFKSSPGIAQIEVHRPGLGKPALWPTAPAILAVAADAPLAGNPALRPAPALLPLNDPSMVADWILHFVRQSEQGAPEQGAPEEGAPEEGALEDEAAGEGAA